MKFVNLILGFGVETKEGTVVTHDIKLNNPKFLKEIAPIVEKYYPIDELWENKKPLNI